jgi:hypothetical protein
MKLSAKKGNRTPTGVTPLEPERTAPVRKSSKRLVVVSGVSHQEDSGKVPDPQDSGACTTILGPAFQKSDEPESSVLRRVQEALWAYGGVHVMRNNAGPLKRKFPIEVGSADLLCIVAPYGRLLAVETKRPKNKAAEEHQERWLEKARRYGAVAAVVRSPEEIGPLVELARRSSW